MVDIASIYHYPVQASIYMVFRAIHWQSYQSLKWLLEFVVCMYYCIARHLKGFLSSISIKGILNGSTET